MKNFHDFYFGLTNEQRNAFVAAAGTTIGYAERVASGYRLPSVTTCYRFMLAAKAIKQRTSVEAIVATYEKRNGPLV